MAALGFKAGGIAAGSVGAWMISTLAPTAAGGLVATLQSVGAAGLGAAGTTLLAAGGGAAGAAAGAGATFFATGENGNDKSGEDVPGDK